MPVFAPLFADDMNTSSCLHYVPYSDSTETIPPDEDRTIQEVIASLARVSRTLATRYHHAVRPSHGKSHALLKGTLTVLGGLPESLAQGLFAVPRTYDLLARLSIEPGELLADTIHTPRGIALKVIGVPGSMLSGHEDEVTQDFLLSSGRRFAVGPVRPVKSTARAKADHESYRARYQKHASHSQNEAPRALGVRELQEQRVSAGGKEDAPEDHAHDAPQHSPSSPTTSPASCQGRDVLPPPTARSCLSSALRIVVRSVSRRAEAPPRAALIAAQPSPSAHVVAICSL